MKNLGIDHKVFISLFCSVLAYSFSASVAAKEIKYPGDRYGYDNTTPHVFTTNTTYMEECGECHVAYAPELLPKASWKKIVEGLEDHFGENAELDQESLTEISKYLKANALQNNSPSIERVADWFDNIPATAPLRVTEMPGFLEDHEDPMERLGEGSDVEGFFSPCEDCHKEAASGIFDKEKLFRGYGPVFKRFSGEN